MKLLQRTIFAEVLRVFTLVLAGLTVVLVFVGVFQQASESGLGPAQMIRIVPYVVPSLLPFTIPATLLLTVCVVYGRVSGDLELTAAKAAGINPIALLTPTILFGVVLSGVSFVLTDRVIPWAFQQTTVVLVESVEDIFLKRLRNERRFYDPSSEVEVIVKEVDDKTLIRPMFRYRNQDGRPIVMQARTAEFHFDIPDRKVFVDIDTGHLEVPDSGVELDILSPQRIELPLKKSLQKPNARELSIATIQEKLAEHKQQSRVVATKHDLLAAMTLTSGMFDDFADVIRSVPTRTPRQVNKLRTEESSRYALSCSCLFFVLLGSPFALLRGQTQFLTSFLYCFLPIVGVYYPLMLGLMSQAKSGEIDPTYTMWLGNFGLLIAAMMTTRKMCRH